MMYTQHAIEKIIQDLQGRKLSSQKAFSKLKNLPYESFSFARLDHHRQFRKGFPEAIYAPGKTLKQLEKIIDSVSRSGQSLIVTRLNEDAWKKLASKFPRLRYSELGRLAYFARSVPFAGQKSCTKIAVVTAGTGDIPVAEEAAVTLELVGKKVERFYDCGIAGLHRLIDILPEIEKCRAVICAAGMDGVLPSVLGGLVSRPVVAVPTSVGYGANFTGLAPLLTMLNSCAQGVAVMNIDNGFGAACFAALL